MQGFLQAAPIGLRDEHGVAALTDDMDWFVGSGINQPVQLSARLGGGNMGHRNQRTKTRTLSKSPVGGVSVEQNHEPSQAVPATTASP